MPGLKTLVRYGPSGSAIDNLTYVYGANKGNRLTSKYADHTNGRQ